MLSRRQAGTNSRRASSPPRCHVRRSRGPARPPDRRDSGPDQQGGPAPALAPITQNAPPELAQHRQHQPDFLTIPIQSLGHAIIRSAVTLRDQLEQPTLRVEGSMWRISLGRCSRKSSPQNGCSVARCGLRSRRQRSRPLGRRSSCWPCSTGRWEMGACWIRWLQQRRTACNRRAWARAWLGLASAGGCDARGACGRIPELPFQGLRSLVASSASVKLGSKAGWSTLPMRVTGHIRRALIRRVNYHRLSACPRSRTLRRHHTAAPSASRTLAVNRQHEPTLMPPLSIRRVIVRPPCAQASRRWSSTPPTASAAPAQPASTPRPAHGLIGRSWRPVVAWMASPAVMGPTCSRWRCQVGSFTTWARRGNR